MRTPLQKVLSSLVRPRRPRGGGLGEGGDPGRVAVKEYPRRGDRGRARETRGGAHDGLGRLPLDRPKTDHPRATEHRQQDGCSSGRDWDLWYDAEGVTWSQDDTGTVSEQ